MTAIEHFGNLQAAAPGQSAQAQHFINHPKRLALYWTSNAVRAAPNTNYLLLWHTSAATLKLI
jgi:hypothetical protein